MAELYHRLEGYDDVKSLLDGSDEDVLVRLGNKPALIRIPGTDGQARARLVSCLLHGNEDSGFRAVVELLRAGGRHPFDLWVLIGNVRAASSGGWFAHRYLDDQEDFNRVWGLGVPTTRMRRCADAMLAELSTAGLEAALDMHNNTGANPPYAVLPRADAAGLHLSASCTDTVLLWELKANTLMQALSPLCPAVAIECGLPAVPEHAEFAVGVLHCFLGLDGLDRPHREPERIFRMLHRVTVRPEVPFAFGGVLSDELDLVLTPGLDGANFGMLFAGSEIGRVHAGAAMPLEVRDMDGNDVTDRYFQARNDGRLVVAEDITPVMMTRTVIQVRRDCYFYIARRCARPRGA